MFLNKTKPFTCFLSNMSSYPKFKCRTRHWRFKSLLQQLPAVVSRLKFLEMMMPLFFLKWTIAFASCLLFAVLDSPTYCCFGGPAPRWVQTRIAPGTHLLANNRLVALFTPSQASLLVITSLLSQRPALWLGLKRSGPLHKVANAFNCQICRPHFSISNYTKCSN